MYRVLPSLRSDLNEGWVWVTRKNSQPRAIIRLTNGDSGKPTYCECLEVDDNYVAEYNDVRRHQIKANEPVVTMNQWYRNRLGIQETNQKYDLKIEEKDGPWPRLLAALHHPQTIVRVATRLGWLSVLLGCISVLGAIATIWI